MRILAGVDWSDDAFAAVEQIGLLYRPDEVILVHGADLGLFQYPIVAEAANLQGYDEFRRALVEAGRQAIERARALLPSDIPSVRTMCEAHHPASFILDQAAAHKADLIVVGTHDHSRLAELVLSSVSHRVLLHATTPTLVVKGKAHPVRRILLAIEGRDDAARLQEWLHAHPFRNRIEVTVLSVVPAVTMMEPHLVMGIEAWSEQSKRYAEMLVNETARAMAGAGMTVSTLVRMGDPVRTICDCAEGCDLIVVGSHARRGLDRFLLGSVSHGVVHRAAGSVLVIR